MVCGLLLNLFMAAPRVVGKEVDAWCTRCRLILAHTIEALVAGRITRVHCNTCGGQHAYRAKPPGEKAARAPRAPRGGAAPAAVVVRDYESLLRGRDPTAARVYATNERFSNGEILRHTTFGVGVVAALKDGNKIEVAFPEGSRLLIQGR